MGKWTPDYTDDVLHSKISTLVSGAIRRVAVEKEMTTSITYENFVTDLDTGDSFTTSIIDILVKEVADKQTRASPTERRLMGERTAKSLRLLASNARSYSDRLPVSRAHARRPVNVAEYLTNSQPNDHEIEEDEEDFDVDYPTTIEGARVNSDLYEALGGPGPIWPPSSARRVMASPSPVSDEWHPPPLRSPTSTQLGSRPWATVGSTSAAAQPAPVSLLSRQASIRRAVRSRVDFNEYSQRRRLTMRDSFAEASETVTEPRERLASWHGPSSSQPGRRFFPFPRGARRHDSANPTWLPDTLSPDADESLGYVPPGGSPWQEVLPWTETAWQGDHPGPALDMDGDSEPVVLRAPVLPEPQLSRHVSPIVISVLNSSGPSRRMPTPGSIPPVEAPRAAGDSEGAPPLPLVDEPVAYPTPGASENENST